MIAFPISDASMIEHAGPLPNSADVVVIGAGVVGTTTALFLARKGVRVVLIEKGRVAGEQSSRNWGWTRQQGRDPDELPIMVEANRHWVELDALTNEDIGLVRGGVTYLASSDKEMAEFEAWLPYARAAAVDTRALSSKEIAALIPNAHRSWNGAIYTASDMRAEPWKAVPALARIAAREGVTIVENCAARMLEKQGGTVSAVVTEQGTIRCSEVVLAGGAWSSLFLRRHGIGLPQLSVRATVAAVDGAPMQYPGGATDEDLAWRPRPDGGYSLAAGGFHEFFLGPDAFRHAWKFWAQIKSDPFGTRYLPAAPSGYPDAWGTPRTWTGDDITPFERIRVLNPKPNAAKVDDLVERFTAQFPDLGPITLKSSWAGMIDTLPDRVPVVDRIVDFPGLTVACGMSGHGFGIGPGFGRVISDLVTGGEVGHELSRFRYSRFSDGSRVELGPAL